MSSYEVTIDLTPPRSFAVKGGSIVFSSKGLPDIKLPVSHTTYTTVDTPEGPVATSVTLPRRIAENEDLIVPFDDETNEPDDSFYRQVFCAAITGLCNGQPYGQINRASAADIVAAAHKIATKATER